MPRLNLLVFIAWFSVVVICFLLTSLLLRACTPSEVCASAQSSQSLLCALWTAKGLSVFFFFPLFIGFFFSVGQRRLWSDCANEQTSLIRRWPHMFERIHNHVMSHHILYYWKRCRVGVLGSCVNRDDKDRPAYRHFVISESVIVV